MPAPAIPVADQLNPPRPALLPPLLSGKPRQKAILGVIIGRRATFRSASCVTQEGKPTNCQLSTVKIVQNTRCCQLNQWKWRGKSGSGFVLFLEIL